MYQKSSKSKSKCNTSWPNYNICHIELAIVYWCLLIQISTQNIIIFHVMIIYWGAVHTWPSRWQKELLNVSFVQLKIKSNRLVLKFFFIRLLSPFMITFSAFIVRFFAIIFLKKCSVAIIFIKAGIKYLRHHIALHFVFEFF